MELIRGTSRIAPAHRGSTVTLGNFDGLHRGHAALLALAAEQASSTKTVRTVVCFEPTPQEFFAPAHHPVRLAGFRDKMEDLRDAGVERVLVLRFDRALAETSAERFVREILVDGLGARAVVVGDDYHFGKDRAGNIDLLRRLGRDLGFSAQQLDKLTLAGGRVSSSRIRAALADGDLRLANELLGRPYRVSGRVLAGQQLGRKLGAPTANIHLRRKGAPRHGIYCVLADGHPAVANFGLRPTVDQSQREILEVHILDGSHELYGRRVYVQVLEFLRPEARFDGLEALSAAIQSDIRTARGWFDGYQRVQKQSR